MRPRLRPDDARGGALGFRRRRLPARQRGRGQGGRALWPPAARAAGQGLACTAHIQALVAGVLAPARVRAWLLRATGVARFPGAVNVPRRRRAGACRTAAWAAMCVCERLGPRARRRQAGHAHSARAALSGGLKLRGRGPVEPAVRRGARAGVRRGRGGLGCPGRRARAAARRAGGGLRFRGLGRHDAPARRG
jgi:hypothetical protein